MITIQVFRSSTGKPVQSMRVSVAFDGLLRGSTDSVYTDNRGEAHFNNDPGNGTVYVDGRSVHKGRIQGRTVVYI